MIHLLAAWNKYKFMDWHQKVQLQLIRELVQMILNLETTSTMEEDTFDSVCLFTISVVAFCSCYFNLDGSYLYFLSEYPKIYQRSSIKILTQNSGPTKKTCDLQKDFWKNQRCISDENVLIGAELDVTLVVRPRSKSGVLFVTTSSNHYILLQMIDGRVSLRFTG